MPRHPLCTVPGGHPAHDFPHPITDGRTLPCQGDDEPGPTFGPAGEVLRMWLWFGQPPGGHESLLMVHVNDPDHGPTFRGLIALSPEDAEQQRPMAEEAGLAIGVSVVCRQFLAELLVEDIPEDEAGGSGG